MDKSVPASASYLLDFIGSIEAPKGYDTIYGNNQGKLSKPITSMTIRELIDAMPSFTKRFGSSASGRYQFMLATLKGLVPELKLDMNQKFTSDLQDRLGFHLLRRRGYDAFIFNKIGAGEFCKRLAMEWASLPVTEDVQGAHMYLKRGQSYYAGDSQNKSLVSPERFYTAVQKAHEMQSHVDVPTQKKPKLKTIIAGAAIGGAAGGAVSQKPDDALADVTATVEAVKPAVEALSGLAGVSGSVLLFGLGVAVFCGLGWWLYNKYSR
jgi:muramidase (phage lysozyme)